MENDIKKISCPLCESVDSIFYTNKKGFDIYKCKNCKLLFMYPVPKNVEVYDDSYFSGAENGYGYVDYDADKEPMVPTFNKYLEIVKGLGVNGGSLLDIGAATGFFMKIAKDRGFEVKGVEVSDFAASQGRKNGLDIVTGDLSGGHFSEGSFNVVTMFDVLEHVPYPKDTLMEVKKILSGGGLLVLSTPDAESFWSKMWGVKWHLIMPPEHIHYFSPKNLKDYLEKNGFSVEVSTKIGKRFTLQYIFKMLYKWTGLSLLNHSFFSNGIFSKIFLPINLYDNMFIVARKK